MLLIFSFFPFLPVIIIVTIISVTLFFLIAARIETARLNFGLASNMLLLLWCVCGGFLLHMSEALFLMILMIPNYEKAVDTAEDVLERGLTVIAPPGSESYVNMMKNSSYKISRELGERTIVPKVIFVILKKLHFDIKFFRKDWYQSDLWVKDKVLDIGSAVVECTFVYDYEIKWAEDYNTSWYRSKEKKDGIHWYPLVSYMLNKKWALEEEFNNHMLRFQQVTVSSVFI